MLYSTDGTPLKEVLQAAAVRRATTTLGRQKPTSYLPDQNAPDRRASRTLRDRLGDVYRVFRSLAVGGIHPRNITPRYSPWDMPEITAAKGVGRPPGTPLKPCRAFNRVPSKAEVRTLEQQFAEHVSGQLAEPTAEEFTRAFYTDALAAGITPSIVYSQAVEKYGSQRKAAAALGISLGKLQRELRKAQA